MNERETVTTLGTLRYLHDRAAEMADVAMGSIRTRELANEIAGFTDDHAREAGQLSELMSRLGDSSYSPPPGFEEMEREHSRLVHEAGREDEALEALLLFEEVAASHYGLAARMDFPPDVLATLREHLSSEQRHVSVLQQRIGTLPVELAGGGVSTDHMFVDDKNPDDFDAAPSGM